MNTDKLIGNIADQMIEAQIKLGYARETVRFYYPLASINALLDTNAQTPSQLCALVEKEAALADSKLGKLTFRVHEGRVEISVPPEGAEYVYRKLPKPAFLVDLITLFRTHHACTLNEIKCVFEKYSEDYVCEKMPEGSDFDYVVHFNDVGIDPYYFCVKKEMGHTIYHRFTKEDYEALLEA